MSVQELGDETQCLNCGSALQAKFCGVCGQRAGFGPRSIASAFSEVMGNIFSYDNRLWRSLLKLCFRPGALTKAYCEGKRTAYLDPLRMFLFLMVIVLLAPDTITLGEYQLPEEWSVPAEEGASFVDRLAIGKERARLLRQSNLEGFIVFTNQAFKQFLIFDYLAGIACLSFLLRLVMRRSYLVEHFVFALHFSCFIMVTEFLLRIIIPDASFTAVEGVVITTLQVVYFPWAFMVVYAGKGRLRRALMFILSIFAFCAFTLPYIGVSQLSGYYLLMPPTG